MLFINKSKCFEIYFTDILELLSIINNVQKMKFSIKDFFSKCDQSARKYP